MSTLHGYLLFQHQLTFLTDTRHTQGSRTPVPALALILQGKENLFFHRTQLAWTGSLLEKTPSFTWCFHTDISTDQSRRKTPFLVTQEAANVSCVWAALWELYCWLLSVFRWETFPFHRKLFVSGVGICLACCCFYKPCVTWWCVVLHLANRTLLM